MSAMRSSCRRYRVGGVPFVNGRPLVWALEQPGCLYAVDAFYEMPSALPAILDAGQADAVLASSYDALATKGRRIAGGIGITSFGPVESVRLFSKVPFGDIRSLALDQSSLTSNALAQILLREVHSVSPTAAKRPPDLEAMLREFDAGVLIGDVGMRTEGEGLYVMDLGQAWTSQTGLPFVWALWIGNIGLDPELAQSLQWARRESGLGRRASIGEGPRENPENVERQIHTLATVASWPPSEVRRYLTEVIGFDLEEPHLEALHQFQAKLVEHGLAENRTFPFVVDPVFQVSDAVAALDSAPSATG